ncbi:MAG: hypothetical protein ABIZ04_09725 [Opitutus sp.]
MSTTNARNGPGTVAQESPNQTKSKTDFALIRKALSSERFESHRKEANETDERVFDRYQWNALICEQFYGPLRTLEVTLRNSLDSGIGVKTGDGNWLTKVPGWLREKEQDDVSAAHDFLSSRGRTITQARMVQEMSFGFWTSFFNSRNEPLFHSIATHVFPGLSKQQRTRGNVSQRFESIRSLRNRIFHFRRIWNRPNLQRDYDEIVEAVGWVNADACRLLLAPDSSAKFAGALAARP